MDLSRGFLANALVCIVRYMRKDPEIATMPRAARTIHVVSWEGPTGV